MSEKSKTPDSLGGQPRGLEKKDRLSRLSVLKKDTKSFAKRVFENDDIKYIAGRFKSSVIHNVLSCADFLKVRHLLLTGKTKVIQARLCRKHLLCSFCAHLRAAKLVQKYLKIYRNIVGSQKSYHITFTIKDGPDLKERFFHLNKSISFMLANRRKGKGELSKITSGIYSYEFKKGEGSGMWHPHIHAIMLTSEFIDFSKLRQEWKEATGDSFQVHVQEFYGNETDETLIKPFLEVFKYSLKLNALTDDEKLSCYQVLFGRKLTNSFGEFRGFKEPENLLDEVSKDDLFYMDLFMRFDDNNGSYVPHLHVEFSDFFKPIFKLQDAYQQYGDKALNGFYDPYALDLLTERIGFDVRQFLLKMIKQNIRGLNEVEELFSNTFTKGGEIVEFEEPPDPLISDPEAETDIQ